jgi:hypothetical protein
MEYIANPLCRVPSGAGSGRAGRDGANGEKHNPVLVLRFPFVLVRAVEKFFNGRGHPLNGDVPS